MNSHLNSMRVVPAILAALIFCHTEVQTQQFFGEDLNGSASVRLASFPNATNARNMFLSSLSGVGTESFESFAAGTGGPLNLSFPGAGSATLSGGVEVRTLPTGSNVGRYPTDGNNFLRAGFGPSVQDNFRIDFTSPVAAFGFMGTDIGDFGSRLLLTFFHSGGGSTAINVPHSLGTGGGSPPDGAVLFFGLISALNPFIAVEFSAAFTGSTTDFFGFDQMTIGSVEQVVPPTVVPEPISMALLGTGLAGIAAARRRRRKVSDDS